MYCIEPHPTSESVAKKETLAAALLAFIEVAGGLLSNSLGLISSSLNTLVDFISSVVMFFTVF